jgi:hypothetical protein
LNGLAVGVRTMRVHVLARIEGFECGPEGPLCETRQPGCVCRSCRSDVWHDSSLEDVLTNPADRPAATDACPMDGPYRWVRLLTGFGVQADGIADNLDCSRNSHSRARAPATS